MGKLDELRRTMGGNVTESAAKRNAAPTTANHPINGSYPPATPRAPVVPRSKNAFEIPLGLIDPDPDQPREEFDEEALGRLAESLRTRGQLQPCRVRPSETTGRFTIICGERRLRAAKIAEMETLSCMVSDGPLNAGELLALQLIENCLREDLRPIDQAKAYRTLMDQSGWSGNRLAKELGIAQSSVVQALALIELPSAVQDMVEQGALPPSTAYEVSKLADPVTQTAIAQAAVEQGFNRSEVAEFVQAVKSRRSASARPSQAKPDPVVVDIGEGITVTVRWKRASKIDAVAALQKAVRLAKEQGREEAA